jgi:2-polyprenyl-3-methyl-5-hydroxy-6-metoxy-1,4-benzoquinol methylase
MKLPGLGFLKQVARPRRRAEPIPGQFQTYSHTLPDRYPWLFRFAAAQFNADSALSLLSFGCSRGDEVFALRSHFPTAEIKGIDVDPENIAQCERRSRQQNARGMKFSIAATTAAEPASSYDAIFCLAVLCLGDLTTSQAQHSDPYLHFADFEAVVTDFARCLKPSGLLLLHTTNFRFSDTCVAKEFDTLLEAEPEQMAPDVQFDRDNRLLFGPRYRAVAFRKRTAATPVPA